MDAQGFPVGLLHQVEAMIPTVAAAHALAAGRPHPCPQWRIQYEGFEFVGGGFGIFDRHDETRHAIEHDLGGAIRVGHDDRQPARASFQNCYPETIAAAQRDINVQLVQRGRYVGMRNLPLEFDAIREPEAFGHRCKHVELAAAAIDLQHQPISQIGMRHGKPALELCERLDQGVDPINRLQCLHRADDNVV